MPKTKSTQTDRTKRASRDPGPERQEEQQVQWRPSDAEESDGTVRDENEIDTNKYDAPRR